MAERVNYSTPLMTGVFFGIFALVLGGLIYLYYHLGLGLPVEISFVTASEYRVVYQVHRGAYDRIVDTISEVEKKAQGLGVKCRITFGEYLDNPNTMEHARLTSLGGCVLESGEVIQKSELLEKTIPARAVVQGIFHGSPSLGPYKIYPQLFKALAAKHLQMSGPVLETYQSNDGPFLTTVMFPVSP